MTLPNTIISLIFNEIEEKYWIKLYFLFIDEIEWKINHHLNYINSNYVLKEKIINEDIFTIYKNKNNTLIWWYGLNQACKVGNLKIVNLIIGKGMNDWDNVLESSCEGGNLKIINLVIKKGAFGWDNGLIGACYSGHLKIVNLMIEKGANDWNSGLWGACKGGNLNMMKLMIEKGANNWNDGLWGACYGDHQNMVNYMIEKGATRCNYCHKSINDHLIKISNNKNKNL